MIRRAALAACAVLLGCASTPAAPPARPAPVIIDNPRFVSTPTGADTGRVYPLLTGRAAALVKVRLICSPQPDGALGLCVADDAAPVEPAFRIAAVRVSPFIDWSRARLRRSGRRRSWCASWSSSPADGSAARGARA
jgi:hypothetical protein